MSPDAFLVASLSARGLARAATRAGRQVVGLDAYADQDSRALASHWGRVPLASPWRFDPGALEQAARTLCPPERCLGLVYGSGFEADPAALARLARGRALWGNDPGVLLHCADPGRFFPLLDELGIPHPPTRLTPPSRRSGWLAKRAGACGGLHVSRATDVPAAEAAAAPHYYQRQVPGPVCSLLFLADGRDVLPIGFNQALPAPPEAPSPWAYAGAVRLAGCPAGRGEAVAAAARALTRALGLRGLNGLDFIPGQRGWKLLELNPRPTASVELWDVAPMPPLFDLHLEACRGRLPGHLERPAGGLASAVAYAGDGLRIPGDFRWPGWCADQTIPGSRVSAGTPLCTVLAQGNDSQAAACRAVDLRRDILHRLRPHPHPASAPREATP